MKLLVFILSIGATVGYPINGSSNITDYRALFNYCPRESLSTLAITCGVRDSFYMSHVEEEAISEPDLTDPTRCLKYPDIVSVIIFILKFTHKL